jgi:hypothetical protein
MCYSSYQNVTDQDNLLMCIHLNQTKHEYQIYHYILYDKCFWHATAYHHCILLSYKNCIWYEINKHEVIL